MGTEKTCYACDWYEAEYGRCELLEIEVSQDDEGCKDFITEDS